LLLKLKGYEVVLAQDGPGALEIAASFHPHIVLLDIGMPGMDGYEAARVLRQQPGGDALIPPHVTKETADAIPGAVFREIPGVGHLSNLEAPEAFNNLLREHLARCGVVAG